MKWTWLDIVAPWGVCLAAVALCAWGAVASDSVTGMGVSIATGTTFAAAIPLWYLVRGRAFKADFYSYGGVAIVLGKKHRPAGPDVELWIRGTARFFVDQGYVTAGQLRSRLGSVRIFFVDDHKIGLFGRWVRGYSNGYDCIVTRSTGAINDTETLCKHELGHVMLDAGGAKWDESEHHRIFGVSGFRH